VIAGLDTIETYEGRCAKSKEHQGAITFTLRLLPSFLIVRKTPASLVVCSLLLAPPPSGVEAQAPQRRVLPELRADVAVAEARAAHIAAGFHVHSGSYVRLAMLAGVGRATRDQARSDSYRFEVQGRFHLDPFREARLGLYGIGGVVTTHDAFRDWQSRLVVGAGVELPAHGRAAIAIEAAFAGGARLSVVMRRLTIGRR
jgi:hypothetical protein